MFYAGIVRKLKVAAFAAIIGFGFATTAGANARNSVLAFRTGVQPGDLVRIVIETSQRPKYSISYLNNPMRMAIDIPSAYAPGIKQGRMDGIFHGHVKEVETREANGDLRFEVRLSSPAEVKNHFVLDPMGDQSNFRLVLDTAKVSAERFATLAGAPETVVAPVAASAPPRPVLPPPPSARAPARNKVIVIDAGHGGTDPGTIGPGGTHEKNVTLSLALELEHILKQNPSYTVIMTRRTDIFLPLRQRSTIGERSNAALFISVHADSSPRRTTKGFSIYTLNDKASDAESKELATKENAADLLGIREFKGYDAITQNILGDLLQTQVRIASVEFATEVVKQMGREVLIAERPHREAPFMVLRSAIPSVLVEVGFLSNPDEEKLLRQDDHRKKVASAISRAVDRILNK